MMGQSIDLGNSVPAMPAGAYGGHGTQRLIDNLPGH
jgi:hypothetical protein